jgi:hypothetical protein
MGLACFRWMGTDDGSKLREKGTANSTVADTMPRHGSSVPKTPMCPQTKTSSWMVGKPEARAEQRVVQ